MSKHKKGNFEYNFWIKVDKTTTCWNWIGCISFGGYGSMGFNGKTHRAHRLSWILHTGSIPGGMFVLHKCDNRKCVNPDHLFLGTQSDNVRDMIIKGRSTYRNVDSCKRGHPMDVGAITCATCSRASRLNWYHKNKESINKKRNALLKHQRAFKKESTKCLMTQIL